jgi:hypothetical protein
MKDEPHDSQRRLVSCGRIIRRGVRRVRNFVEDDLRSGILVLPLRSTVRISTHFELVASGR